jgi:hypothetical protein
MRKLFVICALAAALVGCENSRHGEPCVGIVDEKNPDVKYEVSGRNLVVGFIFSETLFVPAYVILKDLECPRGPAKGSEYSR